MKNLVILILVLAGIAFVGKVVVEKQYESELDDAISLARGFVDLSYDSVKIDFDGSISINGISITPPGLDESIRVQSIRAVSSDRMFPLKGIKVFENGKFPETFELSLRQFSLPIDLVQESQKIYFEKLPKAQECRSFLASFNYAKAGYTRIDADVRIAFDFSDVYNAVVNLEQFDQTSSLTLEWIFDANQVGDLVTQQTSQLPVSEINASYELEPEAASRFVKQCADVFKVTPEVFLEKVVGSSKYSQNSFGADLGPELRDALVTFMEGGARLSLTSKPGPQLKKLEQLQFYQPKDVLRWMNLTVALNDKRLSLAASAVESEEKSEESETAKQTNAGKPKYFSASASQARNHIGRWVRIKRNNQRKPLEGTLKGIDRDDRLMVEMYKHGGLMTLTVGADEIERFEVLNK